VRKYPIDRAIQPQAGQERLPRLPAVPADMRVGNLLRILDEMRHAEALSRSDLARLTSLGVPTVHRLILDLVTLGLAEEIAPRQDAIQVGRPAVLYRLRDRGVLLAGVDIGNETSRFVIASPAGKIIASSAKRSEVIRRRLVEGIVEEIGALKQRAGVEPDTLAGIGIGVAAAVDPASGALQDPPRHRNWQGLRLGDLVEEQLGCPALVHQDDHFAAVAEGSSAGTFPGAQSLVVLEIGTGIGAAMMVDGVTMRGAHGRFGRIAGWPVSIPRRDVGRGLGRGMAKSTLGASLVAGGLVEDYHRREGQGPVRDGVSLFRAAAEGDPVADAVLAWAGREIAELVIRLHRLCDPAGVVLGGGIARGFAIIEPHISPHLPADIVLAPSVLGENAVAIGAVLSLRPFAEAWVSRRLQQLDSNARKPRAHDHYPEMSP
jgi:predicted NBD/HSP70 family sugar kinase